MSPYTTSGDPEPSRGHPQGLQPLPSPVAEVMEEQLLPEVTQTPGTLAADIRDEEHVLGCSAERGGNLAAPVTTRTPNTVSCGEESDNIADEVSGSFENE